MILIFSPSHLLRSQEVRGIRLNVPTLRLHGWFPRQLVSIQKLFIIIQKTPLQLSSLGDSRVLVALCQKVQYIFFIKVTISQGNRKGHCSSACDQSEHGILGSSVRHSLCTRKSHRFSSYCCCLKSCLTLLQPHGL